MSGVLPLQRVISYSSDCPEPAVAGLVVVLLRVQQRSLIEHDGTKEAAQIEDAGVKMKLQTRTVVPRPGELYEHRVAAGDHVLLLLVVHTPDGSEQETEDEENMALRQRQCREDLEECTRSAQAHIWSARPSSVRTVALLAPEVSELLDDQLHALFHDHATTDGCGRASGGRLFDQLVATASVAALRFPIYAAMREWHRTLTTDTAPPPPSETATPGSAVADASASAAMGEQQQWTLEGPGQPCMAPPPAPPALHCPAPPPTPPRYYQQHQHPPPQPAGPALCDLANLLARLQQQVPVEDGGGALLLSDEPAGPADAPLPIQDTCRLLVRGTRQGGPESVWVLDADEAFEHMFGYSPQQMGGASLDVVCGPATNDATKTQLLQWLTRAGKQQQQEVRFAINLYGHGGLAICCEVRAKDLSWPLPLPQPDRRRGPPVIIPAMAAGRTAYSLLCISHISMRSRCAAPDLFTLSHPLGMRHAAIGQSAKKA